MFSGEGAAQGAELGGDVAFLCAACGLDEQHRGVGWQATLQQARFDGWSFSHSHVNDEGQAGLGECIPARSAVAGLAMAGDQGDARSVLPVGQGDAGCRCRRHARCDARDVVADRKLSQIWIGADSQPLTDPNRAPSCGSVSGSAKPGAFTPLS